VTEPSTSTSDVDEGNSTGAIVATGLLTFADGAVLGSLLPWRCL
jgi:hypothetical protein